MKLSQYFERIKRTVKKADRYDIGLASCFGLLCLMALLLRYKLIAAQTFDYQMFLSHWFDYLRSHGIHAFHDNFANYNTPYLILLWLAGFLPVGSLGAVKGISILFDIVLACSVAYAVSYFKPSGYTKYVAFLAVLYLPTVFLNSALWGQCDGIYTSFVVFSLGAALRDRRRLAWVLFGVAFAFKLQAVFFLPFLVFLTFRYRWKLYLPVWAVLACIILSILPVIMGRSVHSTLDIYVEQILHPTADQPMLAWFSPTFYQFLPNQFFNSIKGAGVMLGGAAAVVTVMFAFLRNKLNPRVILAVATLSLFLIPFLLPQIHERYMYTAEIAIVIMAFVVPRFIIPAIVMQFVTIVTYNSYFTGGNGQPQISYPILSLAVLGIILSLAYFLYAEINTPEPKKSSLRAKLLRSS